MSETLLEKLRRMHADAQVEITDKNHEDVISFYNHVVRRLSEHAAQSRGIYGRQLLTLDSLGEGSKCKEELVFFVIEKLKEEGMDVHLVEVRGSRRIFVIEWTWEKP